MDDVIPGSYWPGAPKVIDEDVRINEAVGHDPTRPWRAVPGQARRRTSPPKQPLDRASAPQGRHQEPPAQAGPVRHLARPSTHPNGAFGRSSGRSGYACSTYTSQYTAGGSEPHTAPLHE